MRPSALCALPSLLLPRLLTRRPAPRAAHPEFSGRTLNLDGYWRDSSTGVEVLRRVKLVYYLEDDTMSVKVLADKRRGISEVRGRSAPRSLPRSLLTRRCACRPRPRSCASTWCPSRKAPRCTRGATCRLEETSTSSAG